jgi:ribonuclease-3
MTIKEEIKTELQNIAQKNYGEIPKYILIVEKEINEKTVFLTGVKIMGQFIAYGKGKTKKEAEREAARIALKRIKNYSSNGA